MRDVYILSIIVCDDKFRIFTGVAVRFSYLSKSTQSTFFMGVDKLSHHAQQITQTV